MKIRKDNIYPTLFTFLVLIACLNIVFMNGQLKHDPVSIFAIFAAIFFGFRFLLYLGNALGIINFKDDSEYNENV